MAEHGSFQDKQRAFAAHIRDPDKNPPPADVEDRRMAIYRELFFNNLRNLLGQSFPVLRKLHDRKKWNDLIRQFMIRHQARTPYFLEIPQEFLNFLEHEYEAREDDYPFLLELAHYEWIELALSISRETNDDLSFDPDGNLLEGIPVLSKLAWCFCYQFPVHRITPDYVPDAPGDQPTYLAICRKANDDMDFMELNPVTARLFERLQQNVDSSGRRLLEDLAAEIGYADVAAFVEHGQKALQQMRDVEILLGMK